MELDRNPLKHPPIEVANRGIIAIKNYFEQLVKEGIDYLYETKLLIIGEPGAGKTSLQRKIINEAADLPTEEESTKGIDISIYAFTDKESKEYTVNIWDFAGQQIYKATHQFFLTKRSLYVLVLDTRKEDTDVNYWLQAVELLSNNCPLLVVYNEKADRKKSINETAIRGRFTNVKEFLATNLKTKRGLPELKKEIEHQIQKLPHIGDELPKSWVSIREALETLAKDNDYISAETFENICYENN